MLLGCDVFRPLVGLLDMDTNPESSTVEAFLVLSPGPEVSPSFCGMTGLTPSRDFNTEVDWVCDWSESASVSDPGFSVSFFGVDVDLEG